MSDVSEIEIDLGLRDNKGRRIGARATTRVETSRWATGPCSPFVVVRVHATRGGRLYGATPEFVEVGPADALETDAKAKAVIAAKVEAMRKRYTKLFGGAHV
jgi:hypothetical protein